MTAESGNDSDTIMNLNNAMWMENPIIIMPEVVSEYFRSCMLLFLQTNNRNVRVGNVQ